MGSPEDAQAARDFVLARLAAALSQAENVRGLISEAVDLFVNPDEDPKGEGRSTALESADALIGDLARSVQLALEDLRDVDWRDGEPGAEAAAPEPDPEPARGRRRPGQRR